VRKAELGRKAGGGDVFGYSTTDKGEYVPVPEEAKVVQLIYELAMKDFTFRQIRLELKRRGICSKRGRATWSIAVLGDILRNDVYLGVYRFHKSKHGKDVNGARYMIRRQDQIVVGSREKPNHPPLVNPPTFDLVQQKIAANRKKTSCKLYMATGLLKCPVCLAPMHAKYSSVSSKTPKISAIKYTCSKKPNCKSERLLVSDTNDLLWNTLVELFIAPERIHSLLSSSSKDDLDSLKKQLAVFEKDEKVNKEKLERLLILYLEGNIPQASYVVKSSELEAQAERLSQMKSDLQQQIQTRGKQDASTELIQTIRLLSRSHRRFTEEQKIKVFRSIVRTAHLSSSSVDLELYVEPIQNYQWKYRQWERQTRQATRHLGSLRVRVPFFEEVVRGVRTAKP